MEHSVGEVARLTGVTVRTLHHYDEVGLLCPGARSPAGHRRYTYADLERLQRVLCYRQLGFGLQDIAAILDDPESDPLDHLRRQRRLLRERVERLRGMAAAVERNLEARAMGIQLDPHEMFEVFGDSDPTEHAPEAEQRWGETDPYRESQRRIAGYTKDDWLRLKDEGADVERRFAAALRADNAPTAPEAMEAAEEHRRHIGRWFYECPYELHRGLADMYVADPRFSAHYEGVVAGLANFVHAAIHANADRASR